MRLALGVLVVADGVVALQREFAPLRPPAVAVFALVDRRKGAQLREGGFDLFGGEVLRVLRHGVRSFPD